MKVLRWVQLLPLLLGATACAESEAVEADPDEIEAAVEKADEQAARTADTKPER